MAPPSLGPYALHDVMLETPGAVLYAAERTDGQLAGPLVVKVFKNPEPGLADTLRERATALLGLNSACVLAPLDVVEADGQVALVRPRIEGLSVTQWVERSAAAKRTITPGAAVKVVLDLLAGLVELHGVTHETRGAAWLVHAEISPDEVMLTNTGEVLLLGAETDRNQGRKGIPRHDVAGALSLLYAMLPVRQASPDAPRTSAVPVEIGALLTDAMGVRGSSPGAEAMLRSLREAASAVGIVPATSQELAMGVARVTEPPVGVPAPVALAGGAPPQPLEALLDAGHPLRVAAAGAEGEPMRGTPVGPEDPLGPLVLVAMAEHAGMQPLMTALLQDGVRVVHAADGAAALRMLREHAPQTVVADVALPGVDGWSVLMATRKEATSAEVPFFLLAQSPSTQQTALAIELGADDLVPMPLHAELLARKVRRSVERYASMMQSRREVEVHRTQSGQSTAVIPMGEILPPAEQEGAGPADGSEPTGVIGTLKQMGVAEIVQMLEMGRKNAVVQVTFPGRGEGLLWVHSGEVIHAALGDKHEEEAFYEMARFKEGWFRIHYGDPPDPTPRIQVSTSFLLLEAMRRRDDEQ